MTDRYTRAVGGDVVVVVGWTILAVAVVFGGALDGPLRLLVGGPLLFALPGYALLSALFPTTRTFPEESQPIDPPPKTALRSRGIGWAERLALSVGASLALLAVVGVLLSFVGLPLAAGPIVGVLGGFTVLASGVGVFRQLGLPPERRFSVPIDGWLEELEAATLDGSLGDTALNIVLVVVVTLALLAFGFGLVAPPRGADYSEAALLTGSDSLVAGNYTTNVSSGTPVQTTVSVENHEGDRRTYTLVVVLDRVRRSDTDLTVLERQELTRERVTLDDGDTRRIPTSVRPTLIGRDLRLSYFVYLGDAPDSPTAATADEHLYLWVTVRPPNTATASGATDASSPTSSQQETATQTTPPPTTTTPTNSTSTTSSASSSSQTTSSTPTSTVSTAPTSTQSNSTPTNRTTAATTGAG